MGDGGPARATAPRASGGGALLAPPLVFLTLFLALPLVFVVRAALSDRGLTGVRAGLGNPLLPDAMRRTIALATVVTVVAVVVGTVYSLALVLARGWARGLLIAALLASFWVSLLIRTVGWILFFEGNGLLDKVLQATGLEGRPLQLLQTTPAMYPAMVNVMLPYFVLPVWASFAALDQSQVQAARSLGARPWLVLRRVVLPQARAGVIGGGLLVFTLSLGFYVTPVLIGGPRNFTVGTLVGQQFGSSAGNGIAPAATMSVLLVLAAFVLYLLADRVLGVTSAWGRR
jgi:ABC-type spermidine/putrescine transport system permease subunit I